jgi:lysophospholipase L1-like esterase
MMPKLLIIGDSITLGAAEISGNQVVTSVEFSYVELLAEALNGVQICVDADLQRTTSAVRDSVDSLLATHTPDTVLVMLGGNDADLDWKRFVLSDGRITRSRVPVDVYEKNLRQITTSILASGAAAVLTDMPNHHFELRGPYVSKLANKDVTSLLQRNGGQAASDTELKKYRAAVERVADELDVPLAAYGRSLDLHPPLEMVGVDGVHPSAAAHRLIAESLAPTLLSVCRRKSAA